MGMADYDYEEAVKYRYEYWEREGWLESCLDTLENIGGRIGNWDMIDTIGMIVGRKDSEDFRKIQALRNKSRGAKVLSPKEALKLLKSKKGGTVWLAEWGADGDDYPIEDPEEFMDLQDDGEFDSNDRPTIYSDEDGEYDSEKYTDGLYEIIKARLDYTREEIKDAEKVIEDY